jgi:hypothetical protein
LLATSTTAITTFIGLISSRKVTVSVMGHMPRTPIRPSSIGQSRASPTSTSSCDNFLFKLLTSLTLEKNLPSKRGVLSNLASVHEYSFSQTSEFWEMVALYSKDRNSHARDLDRLRRTGTTYHAVDIYV